VADPRGVCFSSRALTLLRLGYPEQATVRNHDAPSLAQAWSQPFSLAFALDYAVVFPQRLRQRQATREHAEAAIALSTEQGFPCFAADGAILRSWALAEQGQGEAGVAEVRRGLVDHRATGTEATRTCFLAQLAEACGKAGPLDEGLHRVVEALSVVDKSRERVDAAEWHRLNAGLLLSLAADNQEEADTCLRQALDLARHQQAKSWEHRAASSLSRLWQRQGKRADARELLAPIYGWFTEGVDTADLHEAKAILEEL
jgi:predicted ATPase